MHRESFSDLMSHRAEALRHGMLLLTHSNQHQDDDDEQQDQQQQPCSQTPISHIHPSNQTVTALAVRFYGYFVFQVHSITFCWISSYHGLCGSNKLLYKQCAKSMGRPKIRPHCSHIFNRSFWNSKPRKISGIRPCVQNLVDVGRREGGMRKWRILAYFWFFFCFASRPDHTVGPITTNEGSKRVFLRREVPLGGIDNKQ